MRPIVINRGDSGRRQHRASLHFSYVPHSTKRIVSTCFGSDCGMADRRVVVVVKILESDLGFDGGGSVKLCTVLHVNANKRNNRTTRYDVDRIIELSSGGFCRCCSFSFSGSHWCDWGVDFPDFRLFSLEQMNERSKRRRRNIQHHRRRRFHNRTVKSMDRRTEQMRSANEWTDRRTEQMSTLGMY